MNMFRALTKKVIDSLIEIECSFIRPTRSTGRKNILLLRKDVLGDFIIFIPTLKYYREYYREYEISMVVSDISLGLCPLFPFIDKIIPFNQSKFRTSFWYRRDFMRLLAKGNFNVAIYPVYSREAIGDTMIKITKATEKIAFKLPDNLDDSIYTRLIDVPSALNELDKNLYFVSKITGESCHTSFPTIDTSLLNKEGYNKILTEKGLSPGNFAVVAPSSGASYKMWPIDKVTAIIDYLIEKGLSVVICGVTGEEKISEEIIKKAKNKSKIIDLVGKTSLSSLSHLLKNAKLYFGNDTGTLHLAAALNTPSIAIMGGGHFGRFFPYGNLQKNRIVFNPNMHCKMDNWRCSQFLGKGEVAPCIRDITVDSARNEIEDLFRYLDHNQKTI